MQRVRELREVLVLNRNCLLLQPLSCNRARATTMHLWLLLSAALAFVPQRSLPAIRGLQAVIEDVDALSFRELQAACKELSLIHI